MRFGSICSGIEAASAAWCDLGWEAEWLSEVDVSASAVLAYHFGASAPRYPLEGTEKSLKRVNWGDRITNWGDMTQLPEAVHIGAAEAPDILCGGTPCQGFSVAGLRGGLDDPRGQLTLSFVELANAIDDRRHILGQQPCIIFWENVPGVRTDKGNAFGHFLAGLVGADDPVEPGPRPEPGRSSSHWTWKKETGEHIPRWPSAGAVVGPRRTVAWRSSDAQYFGLAQRRERLFVVASARAGFDPQVVLFEFDGMRRDSAPSREAWEDVAGTLAARTEGGGFPGTDEACSGYLQAFHRSERPAELVPTWWDGSPVSQTLDAVLHKGQTMPEKNRFPAVLQPVLSVHGTQDPIIGNDLAHALGRNSGQENAVLPFNTIQITSPNNGANPQWGDPCHSLAAGNHPPAICVTGDIRHTLKAEGFDASEDGTGRGQPIVATYAILEAGARCGREGHEGRDGLGISELNDPMFTLQASKQHGVLSVALRGRDGGGTAELGGDIAGAMRASGGGGDKLHVLEPEMAVRRLMPIECERLQGFEDNWTLVPVGKGKAADGPRYKQLGNSWPVPVVRWIGKRIAKHVAQLDVSSTATLEAVFDDALSVWAVAA